MKKIILSFLMILVPTLANAKPVPSSFADLSQDLLPTVVNISTTQEIKNNGVVMDFPQFPPGSPFQEFFKDFFDQRQGSRRSRKATSLGSGFVYSQDGIIVTNNHVVEKADKITVIFSDDKALEATVLGTDKKTDIAVLKVETDKKLKAVKFENSDELRVGDWVLAIGNPFGLGSTVTAGIVSARARDIRSGPYDDYIQTDASINRGNSGGPLFDMNGKVVGVNTAIFSPSGGSVGIGFAIPSNMAKWVVDSIVKHGKIRRGWLGVKIQTVTEEIAESLDLKEAKGALVASVSDNSPASDAKIQAGDVILEFDGQKVDEMRILPRIVAETKIGKKVNVKVLRNGKIKELTLKVGELEEEKDEKTKLSSNYKEKSKSFDEDEIKDLGIKTSKLTSKLREKFNIDEQIKGVVITDVDINGNAYEKGLKVGNVIVEVNQNKVYSSSDVVKEIAKARKKKRSSVLLLIEDESGMRFSAVKIKE